MSAAWGLIAAKLALHLYGAWVNMTVGLSGGTIGFLDKASKGVFVVGVGALLYWLAKSRQSEALTVSAGLFVLYGLDRVMWLSPVVYTVVRVLRAGVANF